MAERLTFTLSGRDELSRVLGQASTSAQRLRDSMEDAADGSGQAILTLTRDADGRLRDMTGRFISAADAAQLMALRTGEARRPMADWASVADRMRDTGDRLRSTLLTLAPAAIPVAASAAPIAAAFGAGAVAAGLFAAAIVPQVKALSEAAQAQTAYEDAVEQSGARSKEAVEAQAAYARSVAKLPPETLKAAAALGVLKAQYKGWSDSVAGDTMAPVTKGMALLGSMLPRTTGLVRATGTELDRTMTILTGLSQSPGADRIADSFERFTSGVLRRTNDQLLQLTRTADGDVGSGVAEFMAYARTHGPTVGDTLGNIGQALTNLLIAGTDVGVGMLQVVNVIAAVVAAAPPGAITLLFQLAIAIKAVQLAAVGAGAARAAVAALGASVTTATMAAAAAPGPLSALGASFMTLSRTTRLAIAGTGIGLLVIALASLAEAGQQGPANVDRMTTSLGNFAETGKVSGEAAKVLGSDLKGFGEALRGLARPSQVAQIQQGLVSLIGMDSTPVKRWKQTLDDVDKSLASMVASGNGDLAAQVFARLAAEAEKQGLTTAELEKELGDYRAALANAKFEQELAAAAMGIFGAQAQATQQKLAAQKQSTDGLRQSYHELNNAVLMARGGMRGMEAAIDAAAEALKQNGVGLDINTAKGRANQEALDNIASSTMKAAESARESGASWETVNGIYSRGTSALVKHAQAMGLDASEARALAADILKIPDSHTTQIEMRREDALAGLNAVISKIKATPSAKSVTVSALTQSAMTLLTNLGYKVTRLPDGRVTVTARTGTAISNIAAVQRARDALRDKTITITTARVNKITTYSEAIYLSKQQSGERRARGGLVRGPGSTTSDSIPTWLSDSEYVIKASSVARYGTGFLDAVNEGRLSPGAMSMGTGAMPGAGRDVGAGLSAGLLSSAGGVEASARRMAAAVEAGVRAELQIASPSKKTRALAAMAGQGLVAGLTGSLATVKATAAKLAATIAAAFDGRGGTESTLLARVAKVNKSLQSLATQRARIASQIAAAKKAAGEIATAGRQSAELGQLGLQPEEVTAGSIQEGLQQKLARIRQFTAYIGILAKRGLSKTLMQQIVSMGPEQGYAYASALVGMSTSALQQINTTQSQINTAAVGLGNAGADALYDSGKAAGLGFLRGLQSQQQSIERQMVVIAKGMQTAIKKALGIRSPSRVMAEAGQQSTAGLAVGLVERMPVLDRALGVVAGRVADTRPVLGRPAIAGGGAGTGPQQVRIDVHVSGSADPVAVARELRRQLVSLKRSYGLNIDLGVA